MVVVMGVSGSGKSTIGALVANALGVPFVDADGLHPIANIEKMAAGTPLTDEDRWPWLAVVGQVLADASGGVVVACSALRRVYRDAIVAEAPGTVFVHLDGTKAVLTARLEGRSDHFMPPELLDSQLSTLEALDPDERGIVIDIDADVPSIIADAITRVPPLTTTRSAT
ncbi:gluconate kinase (SKI family) [Sanguibacter antarcticus]|uniref:Gluconokinase n=2 Tax=Sanguibacter antarcticus TaxID=372484 RepID=A0A2A9E2M0_9MICO|nr:gluconate kinase (SKI family) [Sanguibacter antarcticus]